MYFLHLYVSFVFLVALLLRSSLSFGESFSAALVRGFALLMIFVYMLLMLRVSGVDFDNYVEYMNDPELSPDFGYSILMYLCKAIGINFTIFLFIQGAFTVYCISRFARVVGADFFITMGIYVLHSAVVRDFSQSRVGLAVLFVYLAFSMRSYFCKLILLVVSVSIHLSILPAIVFYLLVDRICLLSKNVLLFIAVVALLFSLSMNGMLLDILQQVDPRVAIYLDWDDASRPVNNYGQLFFYVILFAISLSEYCLRKNLFMLKFAASTYAATLVLFVFYDANIFAHRLSHLFVIFYPFALGKIFTRDVPSTRYNDQYRSSNKNLNAKKLLRIVTVCILFSMALRSANEAIIEEIVPMYSVSSHA